MKEFQKLEKEFETVDKKLQEQSEEWAILRLSFIILWFIIGENKLIME